MAGGGEVNMGGWLPPPGAFGYVSVCECVCGGERGRGVVCGWIVVRVVHMKVQEAYLPEPIPTLGGYYPSGCSRTCSW